LLDIHLIALLLASLESGCTVAALYPSTNYVYTDE
jgi:hypothetical protein